MVKKLIKLLNDFGGVKYGEFTLSSGEESSYYIDIKAVSTEPDFLKEVGKEISGYVGGVDRLAGIALGGIPLVTATSLESGVPYLMIRKQEKGYGTDDRIEGSYLEGESVVIIEDVTTSGNSVLSGVETLRNVGLTVDKAITVVDRESGAIENLREHGVELEALISVSQLIDE
ncbi:orotate phosphoribosyltransferase [Methanonatronarchaeum sp. AMET-Sl]|uniref:orotate phosphoribosyltransferase n=1 Tax=Methanonatronarchaeum sp. AMET-Sl TaxID=3037654 RepID=UPI00244DEB38|nr:orotate phosphoribosyltransferase [Methanonatronarchaeum sp. AMET-Sl]WGI17598.1 orotate phosphoribosyltransferase [Methanonatronarchaeum sp. AMET-Sl]